MKKPTLVVSLSAVALLAGSALAADPSYTLKVDVPPAKKGEKATARLHIVPGQGYHMNKDFPTALVLEAPAGLLLEKFKQGAKDAAKFEDAGADFNVVFTSVDAGKKVVTGDLKFAVCTATSCDPKREKVSFTIEVK
jgi:hypothetical protein